jgi:hypothetical protein
MACDGLFLLKLSNVQSSSNFFPNIIAFSVLWQVVFKQNIWVLAGEFVVVGGYGRIQRRYLSAL